MCVCVACHHNMYNHTICHAAAHSWKSSIFMGEWRAAGVLNARRSVPGHTDEEEKKIT